MKNILNIQAIRHAGDKPQDLPIIIIRNAINTGNQALTASTLAEVRMAFPVKRNSGNAMPILPYQSLPGEFRQLLLEIGSSITIRAVEKTSSLSALLADPLHQDSLVGNLPAIREAMTSRSEHVNPTHLAPALFLLITSSAIELANNVYVPENSICLLNQKTINFIPESTDNKDLHILFVYYCYNSLVDHGKVELR